MKLGGTLKSAQTDLTSSLYVDDAVKILVSTIYQSALLDNNKDEDDDEIEQTLT